MSYSEGTDGPANPTFLTELAARKFALRSAGIEGFIGTVDPRTFFADYFARKPCYSAHDGDLTLDLDEYLQTVAEAHSHGNMRFVNDQIDPAGLSKPEVEERLEEVNSHCTARAFEEFFKSGELSFVMQHAERYFKVIRAYCVTLSNILATQVSASVFATPPNSTSTAIHYDVNDVFALQLAGYKTWSVYRPIITLPNVRLPILSLDSRSDLCCYAEYDLAPGDVLYLPRGWIHSVTNSSDCQSLHVSFVVHVNSWLSVFANLINTAYEELRADPQWRGMTTPEILEGDKAKIVFRAMLDDMTNSLQERISHRNLTEYCDHIAGQAENGERVSVARSSIEAFLGQPESTHLERTGIGVLVREPFAQETINVSSDGTRFYGLSKQLWTYMESRKKVSVTALQKLDLCSSDEVIEGIEILVAKLGRYKFVKSQCREENCH